MNVLISAPDLYSISVVTTMQTPSLLGNSRNKEVLCCIKVDLMTSRIREFIKVLPSCLVQINKTSAWRVVIVSTAMNHILGILLKGHPCCQEMLRETKRLCFIFQAASKGKKEQERYTALMEKLQEEKKKQHEHVEKVMARLKQVLP